MSAWLMVLLALPVPQSGDDYFKSGNAKFEKKDYDGAIADYTRAIELNPRNVTAVYNRGVAKDKKGDPDGAFADYSRAIELDPKDSSPFNNRGNLRKNKGDLEGALADYSRAIELDSRNPLAFYNRGNIKKDKGNSEEAIADFSRAIEIDPKYGPAYNNRGYARYDIQAWTDALGDFRKYRELNPEDQDYAWLRIWLIRARIGERGPATQELRTFLKKRTPPGEDDWAARPLAFLAGELPEGEFFKLAETKDEKTTLERKCEAFFYAGSMHLIEGDRGGARDLFRKCVGTGLKTFAEHTSAVEELKALDK